VTGRDIFTEIIEINSFSLKAFTVKSFKGFNQKKINEIEAG
jgi:hypothetical protein